MGIAQALPDAYKTTYDFLVNNEGSGLPSTRRLPYADYGLVVMTDVTRIPIRRPSRTHLTVRPGSASRPAASSFSIPAA
ncbi:MAG TPA: hypothetical protein VKV74_15770 [Bryobacteraceae bacterium]|nr:hypothetical protein [Bryobacteraceae bacterium]